MEDVIFIYRSIGYIVTRLNKNHISISGMWGVKDLYQTKQIKVTKLEEGDYYGFCIDGNRRFVLGDCTVTHNTSIAKALSKALSVPFSQISFGGIENTSYLKGHDYTYIGSQVGEITRCMKNLQCKDGIIFFDEFEKSADNKNISSLLLHITDPIQNHEFKDSYLSGIKQDLSNIWFIYSMNTEPSDNALRDRIKIVNVKDYTTQDKIKICKNFFLPKFMTEQKLKPEEIILNEDVIEYLINKVSKEEKGVRQLRFHMGDIVQKVKYLLTTKGNDCSKVSFFVNVQKPFTITKESIDIFTHNLLQHTPISHTMMYT